MADYIKHTKHWLEHFVIGLNLCPFAALPFRKDQIRYVVEMGSSLEDLTKRLLSELILLSESTPEEVETTLIIHPNVLNHFLDYNDFLSLVDQCLFESGLEGTVQIASFHPDYQFGDTDFADAANFTNRSPYPMLHLLRESSVSMAVDQPPDTGAIPEENVRKLRELSDARIKEMINFK